MPTYIVLANFTDQGIKSIKESPDRLSAFRAMADKAGIAIKSVHYTVGTYDLVTIVEGSDEAVTTALLKQGSLGSIRTHTLRAFSPEEMKAMIGKIT